MHQCVVSALCSGGTWHVLLSTLVTLDAQLSHAGTLLCSVLCVFDECTNNLDVTDQFESDILADDETNFISTTFSATNYDVDIFSAFCGEGS